MPRGRRLARAPRRGLTMCRARASQRRSDRRYRRESADPTEKLQRLRSLPKGFERFTLGEAMIAR